MLKFCMCLTVRVCITIYAVPTEFPISVNCKNKVNYGGRRFYTLLDPTVVPIKSVKKSAKIREITFHEKKCKSDKFWLGNALLYVPNQLFFEKF